MSAASWLHQAGYAWTTRVSQPARQFLAWWWGELKPLLPQALRRLFLEQRDEVHVTLVSDAIVLLPQRGAERSFPRQAETLKQEIAQYLGQGHASPWMVYCLPPEKTLRRQLLLPLAARENLRQVLAFEMDRQTPFRQDQVYFDYRSAATASGELDVTLVVAPKSLVETDLQALKQAGLALDAMDVRTGAGETAGFNLLPKELRANRRDVWLVVNGLLGLVFLSVLGLVMHQSLENRRLALSDLRAKVNAVRAEALQVAKNRKDLKNAVDGANFLGDKKRAQSVLSDILLDLTRRLGNDTWLQRLTVRQENDRQVLELQGQSKEAAALITVLQKSPYIENPTLQGAITPDSRTGKEQFVIQSKVKAAAPVVQAEKAASTAGPSTAVRAGQPAREQRGQEGDHAASP